MRGRYLGIPIVGWLILVVLILVGSGAAYTVSLANSTGSPVLPAAPPHATLLAGSAKADMLGGNYVITTALYKTTDDPSQAIAFYRSLLKAHTNQIGDFQDAAHTASPLTAPEALQHMPVEFITSTKVDRFAANYVYTEYSESPNDVGVAVDMRHPHGPTYVFLEMLTTP